jgi:hypothetical protein
VKNIIVITIALAVKLFVMEAFAKAEPPIDTKVKASIKEGFLSGIHLPVERLHQGFETFSKKSSTLT